MIRLKTQLKLLFWMVFAIPLVDIIIFNTTSSLLSAIIIISSLFFFFLLAIFNFDKIVGDLEILRKNAIKESKERRNMLDLTVSDLKDKMSEIENKLKQVEGNNSISEDIKDILHKLEDIVELSLSDIYINRSSHEVTINNESIELTPTEFELLWVFLEKAGKVLTRDFLLERVWGYETIVSTRTVDMAVTRLRRKIDKSSTTISTVKGVGYKFVEN